VIHRTTSGCCQKDIGSSKAHIPQVCKHGEVFKYTKSPGANGRKPMRRVSEKREGQVRKQGSTLKQGRGFAVHPDQRKRVEHLVCVVCGKDRFEAQIHAAHVYPRRLQPCECPEGVVPLCANCHRLYDDPCGSFDLLPYLVTRHYHAESVHAVAVHGVPLRELMDQVTGQKWAPVEESPKRSAVVV
jgi:hypothetical protein